MSEEEKGPGRIALRCEYCSTLGIQPRKCCHRARVEDRVSEYRNYWHTDYARERNELMEVFYSAVVQTPEHEIVFAFTAESFDAVALMLEEALDKRIADDANEKPSKFVVKNEVVADPTLRLLERSGTFDWEDMNVSFAVFKQNAKGHHEVRIKITYFDEKGSHEVENSAFVDAIVYARIPTEEFLKVHLMQFARATLIEAARQAGHFKGMTDDQIVEVAAVNAKRENN